MVDFPTGTPLLPDIILNDTPGGAAGGLGIRTLINRANDNILAIIDDLYNNPLEDNPVINGGPSIWNEGVTFAAAANGVVPAEMWVYSKVGTTAVRTINQSTDVPAISATRGKINYSIHLDVTTADAAVAAGDVEYLEYRMEGFNFNIIAQRAFTIRFWVKAAKTGIHCVAIKNSGFDRSYIAEYTINNANTWEEKSITIPASPTGGTWDYTNGTGVRIQFALMCGSTFQTPAGVWTTGNFIASANQVNEADSTANDFRICGLRIKAGSYCPGFIQRPYQLEFYLVGRYSFIMSPAGAGPVFGWGQAYATNACVLQVPTVAPFRAAPTITISAAGDFHVSAANFTNNSCAGGTFGIYNAWPVPLPLHIGIQVTSMTATTLTVGQATQLYAANSSAFIKFLARLA